MSRKYDITAIIRDKHGHIVSRANNSYVKTVKEYVITAGSEAYPDDRAFIPSEVFSAREEKLKKYQEAKEAKKSAPTATAAPLHQAMGFAGISRGF